MSSQSMRTTAFILSLIGGIVSIAGSLIAAFLSAFGTPYGTYYGMGPGMMGGYGMGPGMMGGGMMGRGMMGGYGMGHGMMGPGYYNQSEECQKFLDETSSLRKELHDKRFEYMEALRNPKTTAETDAKLRKEIDELQGKISNKAPLGCYRY